jgi:hypothetical protein
MKCSRVALSLLMAAFGGAVIALGPMEGRGTSAADFGPQPPPCMDSLGYENQYQGATDWRDMEPYYGEYRQEEQGESASTHEAYRSYYQGEDPSTPAADGSSGMTPDDGTPTDGTPTDGTPDPTSAPGASGEENNGEGMDSGDPAADEDATDDAEDEDASHHYGYEPVQSPYGNSYDYYRNGQSGTDYSSQYKYSYPTEKYGYWDNLSATDTANQQTETPQADGYEYDYTYDDFRIGDPDFVPYVPSDVATDAVADEPEQTPEYNTDSMNGSEGEESGTDSDNTPGESMDNESAPDADNDGDAYTPAADSNEPSGTESYDRGAYVPAEGTSEAYRSEAYGSDAGMNNSDAGQSYDSSSVESPSYDGGAYVPAEDTSEAYRSDADGSDAGMNNSDAGQSYDSESVESPSYESGPDYSHGHDQGDRAADQVNLSAYLPGELLSDDDQELLRRLSGMLHEDSQSRRAALQNYLESECSDILGLANRLQEATGTDVLGLADNLPGAAAFLAVFRLVERSDLSMDQAVVVLQENLESPSGQWIREVEAIGNESTASVSDEPYAGVVYPTQGRSALEIVKAWTTQSLSNLDGAIRNISLPTVSFSLPSWTNLDADERTATDSARAGEPTSF